MKTFLSLMALLLSLHAQEIYSTFIVEASQSANLSFDAGGIVNKVNVDISKKVKKGEVLAQLNNDDLIASLDMAKAELKNAEIILNFAKRDYDRQTKVKHLIDEGRYDVYTLALQKAKVKLQEAKAKYAYQEALLNKTKLYAPFDGVIFAKDIEVGDVVNSMMLKTVFKIQSPKKRKLILSYDQKYWKMVKIGQTYQYHIDGDKNMHKAKITKIYPSANLQDRKIKAEVETNDFVVGLIGDGNILIEQR